MVTLGKIDTVTKEYMKDPAIFADAFNKFLYHGRQVIDPRSLTELDTTEIALPYGGGGAAVPEQKYRDVLKLVKTDGDVAYCILGIEGQGAANYAMPVKNMVYDAMQLAHQVTVTAASHKQKKQGKSNGTKHKPSSEEYLSGFYKTDRLLPVITLTILWGPEKWDGPLSLKEMYATVDAAIMQYAPEYRLNLIAPGQMTEEEIHEFKTSLKEVMLYIKYSKDKARLQEVTQSDKNFRNLDRQAAEVINVTTNSQLKYPEGSGMIDMCAAIEEIRNESRLEGITEGEIKGEIKGKIKGEIKGTIETYKEVGLSIQETIQRTSDKFNLSLQQAEAEVKKHWKI